MSGVFCDTYADLILDSILGGTPLAVTSWYVGLSTTQPNSDGTNVTEPNDPSYARVEQGNDTGTWPNAAGRSKSNGEAITFPTAAASWGDPLAFVIFDAANNGNALGYGTLTAHGVIAAGITPSFAAGTLTLSLPGA